MRTRHPARLAARIVCWLIEPHPVDHEALDSLIEQEAARESAALSYLADPAVTHARSFGDSALRPAGLEGFENKRVSFLT